jgi:hypothetical protein
LWSKPCNHRNARGTVLWERSKGGFYPLASGSHSSPSIYKTEKSGTLFDIKMATGNPATPAADQAQSTSLPQNTETPQALKSWWNGFKKRTGGKKEAQGEIPCVHSLC